MATIRFHILARFLPVSQVCTFSLFSLLYPNNVSAFSFLLAWLFSHDWAAPMGPVESVLSNCMTAPGSALALHDLRSRSVLAQRWESSLVSPRPHSRYCFSSFDTGVLILGCSVQYFMVAVCPANRDGFPHRSAGDCSADPRTHWRASSSV